MKIATWFHIIYLLLYIMYIITILRVVACFHRGYKSTIEGLKSCVCCSRGREQEQFPHIPDSIRRDCKCPSFDTRKPNHDKVHLSTVSLDTVSLETGYSKKKTANHCTWCVQSPTKLQSNMTLVLCWLLQFQCPNKSIYLNIEWE